MEEEDRRNIISKLKSFLNSSTEFSINKSFLFCFEICELVNFVSLYIHYFLLVFLDFTEMR